MPAPLIVAFLVVAVLWLFARMCGDIYKRKGRDPWLGRALGLLGPLGLIIAWSTPKVDRRAMHPCVHCHHWIDDAAIRCPRCGRGLRVATRSMSGRLTRDG